MRIELDTLDAKERHKLLNGTVVPRAIGWISTVDDAGRRNLAPFSWFTIAASTPPVLMFSVGSRDGVLKDTGRNAVAIGGFVAHVAGADLVKAMNDTSVEAPEHVDEFDFAHLDATPSERVAAPRVAAAPVAFECETLHHYAIPDGGNTVVFGRVLLAHVRDDVRDAQGYVDVRALDPVARLAGLDYASLGDVFAVPRPTWPPED